MKIKGIYGAMYEQEEGNTNIKVIKKDKKTFWIPIEDIQKINKYIDYTKTIRTFIEFRNDLEK